jgi:MYXO-CTERM domain-containing protein
MTVQLDGDTKATEGIYRFTPGYGFELVIGPTSVADDGGQPRAIVDYATRCEGPEPAASCLDEHGRIVLWAEFADGGQGYVISDAREPGRNADVDLWGPSETGPSSTPDGGSAEPADAGTTKPGASGGRAGTDQDAGSSGSGGTGGAATGRGGQKSDDSGGCHVTTSQKKPASGASLIVAGLVALLARRTRRRFG